MLVWRGGSPATQQQRVVRTERCLLWPTSHRLLTRRPQVENHAAHQASCCFDARGSTRGTPFCPDTTQCWVCGETTAIVSPLSVVPRGRSVQWCMKIHLGGAKRCNPCCQCYSTLSDGSTIPIGRLLVDLVAGSEDACKPLGWFCQPTTATPIQLPCRWQHRSCTRAGVEGGVWSPRGTFARLFADGSPDGHGLWHCCASPLPPVSTSVCTQPRLRESNALTGRGGSLCSRLGACLVSPAGGWLAGWLSGALS